MKFSAVEHVLPSKVVTNDDMVREILSRNRTNLSEKELQKLEKSMWHYFKLSKSSVRYHRNEKETALECGVEAGRRALRAANMAPKDIDLLIYVGVGRGYIEPATSNVFQKMLKLKNATCFDVLDACASWLRAFHIAKSFIKTGMYKNVMIYNCEFNFKEYVNFNFKSVSDIEFNFPIFTIGEAATVTILSHTDEDDEYYSTFMTWGEGHNMCKIPLPNFMEYSDGELNKEIQPLSFFSYGEKLFRFVFPRICKHYSSDEMLTNFNHDIVFGHAASDTMSEKIVERCKLGAKKLFPTHANYGNTVSASVPLAMSLALKEGKLQKDTRVLIGFGSAGVSTAWSRFKFIT